MTRYRSSGDWLHLATAAMRAAWAAAAVAIGVAGLASFFLAYAPDTPGNAVIHYAMDRQVGDLEGAERRLCERLRQPAGDAERQTGEAMVDSASLYGEGTVALEGDRADVAVDFHGTDRRGVPYVEPWVAHMVRENGRWTVCGIEPTLDDRPWSQRPGRR